MSASMSDVRLSLPTVFVLVAIVGAGAFAAGRSTSATSSPAVATPEAPAHTTPLTSAEDDPHSHAPMGGFGAADPNGTALPPGHPPVDPNAQQQMLDPAAGAAPGQESSLTWKAPPRWQSVPNASTMRLATFRIPRAAGDTEDAELSITQAGGSVDANAERWIGQFDAAAQKSAKRSVRKVGSLDITIVEVQGNYSGGMGKEPASHWALLGAIVPTPGMPHFFKVTGPVKSVLAARSELDGMLASLTTR